MPLLDAESEDKDKKRIQRLSGIMDAVRPIIESASPGRDLLIQLMTTLASLFEARAAVLMVTEHGETRLAASSVGAELGTSHSLLHRLLLEEDRSALRWENIDEEGRKALAALHQSPNDLGGSLLLYRGRADDDFLLIDEEDLCFVCSALVSFLATSRKLRIFSSIFDSLSEVIAVSRRQDSSGQIERLIMMNAGGSKLLGWNEIIGKPAREIYPKSERPRIAKHLESAVESARTFGRGERDAIECDLRCQDQALVRAEVSFRVFRDDLFSPPFLYTIGIARVIEFRAEDHKLLSELLESMDIAYFRADADGKTIYSNSVERQITGYTKKELDGLPRKNLYLKQVDRDKMLIKAGQEEGKVVRLLLPGKRKDGSTFWGECDIRVRRDPTTGTVLATEGFYRDVSSRIELQGFLNEDTARVYDDAELLGRLKADVDFHRDYLSSIGHQIQSPLGSVAGMLENLRTGVLSDERFQDRLRWALGQVRVCARLMRNLAYLDRLLRGEELEIKPVSLGKLAVETKIDFLHLLRAKGMELDIDDESLDRFLPARGHPELLRQVLVNLVDNAIKYSFHRTTIRVRAVWVNGGSRLEVSNRGLPVPPNLREKIFERRYRTDHARASVPDGTGLGLWLVRKIVEAHNAAILCTGLKEDGEERVLFQITFPPAEPEQNTQNRRTS